METSPTGALRYNTDKLKMALVPPSLDRYVAAGFTYGAKKYSAHNWRKGFDWSSVINSLKRHIAAFEEGEDIDIESGLPHLALIGCNVAMLIEFHDAKIGNDDRFRYPFDVVREPLQFYDYSKPEKITP